MNSGRFGELGRGLHEFMKAKGSSGQPSEIHEGWLQVKAVGPREALGLHEFMKARAFG
jgi:hypothetical protein